MQYTTNYNLKKPEGADPVNIQDFNDNADSLDTELKKRVASSGGDISNTKIATADSITTEFPVPAAGDTPKAFLGKMKKFAEDFKNLKTGLLTIGMLVNNCTTNNANLPLSAAQGKVLMDLYTQLNGERFLSNGSVSAIPGDSTKVCELTLKAGHRYLTFGYSQTSESDESGIMSINLVRKNGTASYLASSGICRGTMNSGGGLLAYAYVECQTDVIMEMIGYGYSSKSYKYIGHIFALQLR